MLRDSSPKTVFDSNALHSTTACEAQNQTDKLNRADVGEMMWNEALLKSSPLRSDHFRRDLKCLPIRKAHLTEAST